jgi:hypothetical protein
MIGRTEDERDLLHVEGGCDVGGDDRLRMDERDGDEEETIDDSHECEEERWGSRVTRVRGARALGTALHVRGGRLSLRGEVQCEHIGSCRPGRHHYIERCRIVSKARGK